MGAARGPAMGLTRSSASWAEWARTPQREQDGTATWSLSLLQKALRQAPDGLPEVSTFTIWRALHAAGLSWQKSRTWCQTGVVMRKRKHGVVRVSDPDALAKKADRAGLHAGRTAWAVGLVRGRGRPLPGVPHPGASWQPRDHPAQQPHEYIRGGTTKILTLF